MGDNSGRNFMGALVSGRNAVVVIAILTVASAAGWFFSEIIPRDVSFNEETYRAEWGDVRFNIVDSLRLYDPFHSFWYRSVLALFAITLSLCVLTGWKGYLLRSFRVRPPSNVKRPGKGTGFVELTWGEAMRARLDRGDILGKFEKEYARDIEVDPERVAGLYHEIKGYLSKKGFRTESESVDGVVRFTSVSGRWHYPANLLFHIGILVITIGGMIGSFGGSTEMMYARNGEVLRLGGRGESIRIERFRIEESEAGEVSQYVTDLVFLDSEGDSVGFEKVKVNHPVSYSGLDIYQSSYYIREDELAWARLTCIYGDDETSETLVLEPGRPADLRGRDWTVTIIDFKPDFRMGPKGAYNASNRMLNPALKLEIRGSFGKRNGWIFLRHPSFRSRLGLPVEFNIDYLEPAYYTGLQVSSSPGAATIITGIFLAALGLAFMYTVTYRLLRGKVDRSGFILAGAGEAGTGFLSERGDTIKKELLELLFQSFKRLQKGE